MQDSMLGITNNYERFVIKQMLKMNIIWFKFVRIIQVSEVDI